MTTFLRIQDIVKIVKDKIMKNWQYKTDQVSINSVVDQTRILTERGNNGYELVSTILISGNMVRFYWKKPIV